MTLAHLVRPPGVPGDRPPPLVVLLHGLGADEHDLFGLAPWLDPRAVVVSARAPMEAWPMGHSWFDIDWSETPPRLDHEHVAAHRELVLRFADEAGAVAVGAEGGGRLVGEAQDELPVVPVEFGHEARERLGELGMAVDFCEYPIGHEISEQGLSDMAGWLSARIDESERG